MHLRDSPTEARFRADLHRWLAETVPGQPPAPDPHDWDARRARDTAWQRRLHEAGYAGINWPQEFGGRGATPAEHLIFLEEAARAGAPDVGVNFVGLLHAGPTLVMEGRLPDGWDHPLNRDPIRPTTAPGIRRVRTRSSWRRRALARQVHQLEVEGGRVDRFGERQRHPQIGAAERVAAGDSRKAPHLAGLVDGERVILTGTAEGPGQLDAGRLGRIRRRLDLIDRFDVLWSARFCIDERA